MELGEPGKKKSGKKAKLKGVLGLIRGLIERARARHELTCLVMGTIFLVYFKAALLSAIGVSKRVAVNTSIHVE